MGEFEHEVRGTFTATNESLDAEDVQDDDDEDDVQENEEAAFIAHQPSTNDDSNL